LQDNSDVLKCLRLLKSDVKIVPYMNNSFAKEMVANIQSRIGLKQFVIMATGCTISSQCKTVTEFQIN